MSHAQQQVRVHKFGGSSLADAERFASLRNLLQGKNEVIVVSAARNTTTELQQLLDLAKEQKMFSSQLQDLQQNHITLVQALLPTHKHDDLLAIIQQDFSDLDNMLQAVQLLHAYSKEIQDLVLGYGELWSAQILTAYLSDYAQVAYLDATTVLTVVENNGMLSVDWQASERALAAYLQDKTFDQLVVTGFIAATPDGRRTILGRNGSDFSGAIFARLFAAESLTIWTDVDGIYSADPRRVRAAFPVQSLSYKEALELAYFGAKVLHPKTIAPVVESHIPIYIKNSFKPEARGTLITADNIKSEFPIKGLCSIDDIALVTIEGTGLIGVTSLSTRVFQILQQKNIAVVLISQASSDHSICFAVMQRDASTVLKELTENLGYEIQRHFIERVFADQNCAIVSAVGDEMIGATGVAGKFFDTLAKANVNIRAIAQGSSERNISVVINKTDVNRALRAVHAGFYLSNKTIAIGLIGPGVIGSTLLKQIHEALPQLNAKYQVNLCVRGIMNSKKMLLEQDTIDLSIWKKELDRNGVTPDLNTFANQVIADDMPHGVIIDCTANKDIGNHYLGFIERGIHVITPNKHANAGDLNYYKQLKMLTQQKKRHYLYEATVCAGLPVINTLQDLIKTGDEIISVEGIVSGTLSFLFSELASGQTFSSVLMEAKRRGYTEPDPREDLSGMDVARKLICLAREIGHDLSLADVIVTDLVPSELQSCSVDEFIARLPEYDDEMATRVAQATARQEKLCYVGSIARDGRLHVAINSYPQTHPFARMKGTDNMLIFHTKRYHEQPLIIQGPGAGAEVTAGGIFADLLRLVSFIS
jgi:aspartokinase/homoserine dehydrogenase 1